MKLEVIPYKSLVELFFSIHDEKTGLTHKDYDRWFRNFDCCPETLLKKDIKLYGSLRELDIRLWKEIRKRRIGPKIVDSTSFHQCGICSKLIENYESMYNLCKDCMDHRKCDICGEMSATYGIVKNARRVTFVFGSRMEDVVICHKHPLASLSYCNICETYTDKETNRYVLNWDEPVNVCSDCDDRIAECDGCGVLFNTESNDWVECEDTRSIFCGNCAEESTFYCQHCDSYLQGYGIDTGGGDIICESCASEYYIRCPICDDLVEDEYTYEIVMLNGRDLACQSCIDEEGHYCEHEEEYIHESLCPLTSWIPEHIVEISNILGIISNDTNEILKEAIKKLKGE